MTSRFSNITATLLGAWVVAGCASGGAGTTAQSAPCDLRGRDSVFAAAGPVYRECAVDVAARFVAADQRPEFEPKMPPRSECLYVDLQFVVSPTGKAELSTARIERTNDDNYADGMKANLASWRYDPAMRGGQPVRQIVLEHRFVLLAVSVTRVPAGSTPPAPQLPPVRPQNC
jgi:hypothetical protein